MTETLSAPTRISWFRVFNDLKRAGWSVHRIERHLSISKSTLLGWKAGASPRHEDGEAMIALWQGITGGKRDELPTERRYPNAYHRR